ncbi:MAG TPA: alanine racemase [Pyrinomonadaceae bacterium]|jgi:D-serine deaminase-like pyridoxal phosphate-dependent protein
MEDLQQLKTPCLVLDIERVRSNAQRVSQIAKTNGVKLRPHIKTHKCIEIAQIQTNGHSGAITASTLAEVRAFSKHGFNDITYAVPIEPGKFTEAIEIAGSGVNLNLITDSTDIPPLLNNSLTETGIEMNVFFKVDCGSHRCGVEPHSEEAFEIPRLIADASNLNFAGILTHAGHSYNARSQEEIAAIARHERDSMAKLATRLRSGGIEVPIVSIGSTPTITRIDHLKGIDEIRPGNYILFDGTQAALGSCNFEDCALTVLAAVIHIDRSRKKVILDAGAIAVSKDRGAVELDSTCGYGRVLDLEGKETGLRLESLSQEHGVFHVKDDAILDRLQIGTRMRVLANHSCLTAAQHSYYNVLENGRIVDKWKIHSGW